MSACTNCFLLVTIQVGISAADEVFYQVGNCLPYLLSTFDVYYNIASF
jgi:hypothetical protein